MSTSRTHAEQAGAKAPAEAPEPKLYRVGLTASLFHTFLIESTDSETAKSHARQEFLDLSNGQRFREADGLDITCECDEADS
jgi:hypothetical protein